MLEAQAQHGYLPSPIEHLAWGPVEDLTKDGYFFAGTPDECIARIQEYRDAGCTHIMLEVWGEDREQQAKLFGEAVLPHFKSKPLATGH